ncbi:DPP IV N-terminal domain-containing protein [Paenibacillus melissococcoides]|uniref:DPP IV N-terminal domain-containing protein n=1 Tax=Paenibacillus melissococcoides TaxID=2912268 RepID=A0ABM9G2J5_9BACL|nr:MULTISPECIES: DPP IV N-terminal domain-containing protein [Paenibacillus]MEB9894921.1 DPP IV N-terminal domain-containing protein [Bacillus cereus]CAH8245827.1 DPP IV N-terminal domain-containing protein [Paenibacillus melissococcoides]CAH8712201.1 DPP IV N-terminal domain-containing protein [Paenibacillus melissococcoides]CAH8712944.1 DPP IV N-terminal domain-containing protein [Paenibacillus melissococcoides]GIO80968.1 putative dipeptidyl peptidase IV [Paenibacillus dendritiformis]
MSNMISREQYDRAARLLSTEWQRHVFNGRAVPNWLAGGNRFWYRRDVRLGREKGTEYILVDPETNTSKPAFDHERLASSLGQELDRTLDRHHLKLERLELPESCHLIRFDMDGERWECDLSSYRCTRLPARPRPEPYELPSPDGQWGAYAEKHNLFVRHIESGEVRQLTFGGEPYYDYAGSVEAMNLNLRPEGKSFPAALWSPDSTKIMTMRLDQRSLRELHLLQNVPSATGGDLRPVQHAIRYACPGDPHVPLADIVICDIERQDSIAVEAPRIILGSDSPFNPLAPQAGWSKDSKQVFCLSMARDYRSAKLIAADAETGAARLAVEEQSDTFLFIDLYHFGNLDLYLRPDPNFRLLHDDTALWLSERDGHAHLYLFDSRSGQIIRQITSGEWNVRRLAAVDERQQWIYFTASAREPGRDPYYQHLYRIRPDGSGLRLLTPEDADHKIAFAPDMSCFTDTYSRVDLPPVSVLRHNDGSLARELERADIDMLLEQGYQLPERFTVKAADGVTDLYGILVPPASREPGRKYPLIDYFYGGPQLLNTPKSFLWESAIDFSGGAQSFAQLGFVTIVMDGTGTPYRSKAFHDASDGRLEHAAGLADHAAAIPQLAERYPIIDSKRVGIWGVSGGGYGSARAILTYPDVYSVAVSGAGNHENKIDNRSNPVYASHKTISFS